MRSSFQQNVSGFSTQIYTVKNTPTVFLFHNFKNYCSVSCRVFLFANPVNVFETKLNYFCLGHFPPKDILWSNLPQLFSQRINNSPITYRHYDSTFLNESLSIHNTNLASKGYNRWKTQMSPEWKQNVNWVWVNFCVGRGVASDIPEYWVIDFV